MRFPSIKAVRKELVKKHRLLRQYFPKREDLIEDESDFSGVDVRLQVTSDGWCINTGDASFDLSHRGCWGSSCITWERENLEDVARSLVEQAKCHMQECAC
jgi:hypothetical protein